MSMSAQLLEISMNMKCILIFRNQLLAERQTVDSDRSWRKLGSVLAGSLHGGKYTARHLSSKLCAQL